MEKVPARPTSTAETPPHPLFSAGPEPIRGLQVGTFPLCEARFRGCMWVPGYLFCPPTCWLGFLAKLPEGSIPSMDLACNSETLPLSTDGLQANSASYKHN